MMTAMMRGRVEDGLGAAANAGADLRRGACPTLAAPMETGDGLLVRLRPAFGFFTPEAFLALLDAAEAHGNGRLDITARGNLQIRGLTGESVARLSNDLDAAGIIATAGVAVETPPLAGIDPSELADPRPLAARLSAWTTDCGLTFAPKLSIVVDGGGRIDLSGLTADLRLSAGLDGDHVVWHLSIAGKDALVRTMASGSAEDITSATVAVLRRIAAIGPLARARDLNDEAIRPAFGLASLPAPESTARLPVGTFLFGDRTVLGLAPSFGQMEARPARHLVVAALTCGLSELRLSPGRGLLLLGLSSSSLPQVADMARHLGFVTDAADPAIRIDACAGAGACASGAIGTQATARLLLVQASALMDGSVAVHVSGCSKGCARPRAAGLTLVGGSGRHGLVVGGPASSVPVATSPSSEAHLSIAALGRLVAQTKQSGESAASCLKRLGPARIAASFQRD